MRAGRNRAARTVASAAPSNPGLSLRTIRTEPFSAWPSVSTTAEIITRPWTPATRNSGGYTGIGADKSSGASCTMVSGYTPSEDPKMELLPIGDPALIGELGGLSTQTGIVGGATGGGSQPD